MRFDCIALLCTLFALQTTSSIAFTQNSVTLTRASNRINLTSKIRLNGVEDDLQGRKGMKGYYRRPSRAIEKGGGFFVPGLEGERIRVLTAGVLLLMLVANRSGVQIITWSQIVSEVTGILVTILLFLQGLVEAYRGSEMEMGSNQNSYLSILQSSQVSSAKFAVENLATSIVQTCGEVTYVLALSDSDIIVELGPVNIRTTSRGSATKLFSTMFAASANISNSRDGSDNAGQTFFIATGETNDALIREGIDLPTSTRSVGVVVDSRSWVWIVASNKAAEELNLESSWLKSLLSAPI